MHPSPAAGAQSVETERRAAAPPDVLRALDLYRGAFDEAATGLGFLRLSVDGGGELVAVNRALCTFLGRSETELLGRDLDDFEHPDEKAISANLRAQVLQGDRSKFSREKRFLRPDGAVVWALCHGSLLPSEDGTFAWGLGQLVDISALKQSEERLTEQASHDALTGLANRTLFLDRLGVALARGRRGHGTTGVIFIDLDDFKVVNDAFGHETGDRVLVELARRLATVVRPADTASRFGGDEFAVLCGDLEGGEIDGIAWRVAEALAEPLDVRGTPIRLTVSAGIAVAPPGGTHLPERIVDDADTAMYRAKRQGKSRVRHFDQELRDQIDRRFAIEADLRRALERGDELVLAFQDEVELSSLRPWGIEALVRWRHPERGLELPGSFISVAEGSSLCLPLGEFVLHEACRHLAGLRETGASEHLGVSVNVSARQLADPGFVRTVHSALDAVRLPPDALCLEVTERVLLEDAATPRASLRALRDSGVLVAIDDFGTGYSALGYLRSFAVDLVKIDRSFVAGLGEQREATAIVQAVIAMTRALGLRAVAEGVETQAQCDVLVELGCEYGQGYLFGRPELPSGRR